MAGWGFNDGNKLMAVMKGYSDPNGVSSGLLTWKSKMPAMFVNFPANQNDSGKKGHMAIALNTHQSSDSLRTEWEYYVVDSSVTGILRKASSRTLSREQRDGAATLSIKMSLLDGDGKVVITDRIERVSTGMVAPSSGDLRRSEWDEGRDPVFTISPLLRAIFVCPIAYQETRSFQRKLTLTLDELKAVKRIKCELTD